MHVTGIATISLDGRITPPDLEGTPFASPETRANFFATLRANDVSVSGRRTFDAVRDMMLHALRTEQDVPMNVVQTRNPAAHAEEVIAGRLEFTDLGPEALVADLEARGHESLLVAGGGEIYAAFAVAGLVDEWMVAVEPVLLCDIAPTSRGHAAAQNRSLWLSMPDTPLLTVHAAPPTTRTRRSPRYATSDHRRERPHEPIKLGAHATSESAPRTGMEEPRHVMEPAARDACRPESTERFLKRILQRESPSLPVS